jgi:hypothetical protein
MTLLVIIEIALTFTTSVRSGNGSTWVEHLTILSHLRVILRMGINLR